jgi:hypothetical protein
VSDWLVVLGFTAVALWGRSRFGHARYSFVYGVTVWCGAFVASMFIGDWAVAIGMLVLAARWFHLRARADEERAIFGVTMSDVGLMRKSFEHDNPGVPYQAPADRDELIAQVRAFKSKKHL